jgi:hypothetical protein
LRVKYGDQSGAAETSYQVKGVGGAAINIPSAEGTVGSGTGLIQLSFKWWNGAVPLLAIFGLLGLSRIRFGVSDEELRAIVEAQNRTPAPSVAAAAQQVLAQGARLAARTQTPARPVRPPPTVVAHSGPPGEARLTAIEPVDPIPAEYTLLKTEVSLGRGEDNDIVIPHPSVSRSHARLARRDGSFVLTDLNSTNGSYVNNQAVEGSAVVNNGSEVRLGDIRFLLHC